MKFDLKLLVRTWKIKRKPQFFTFKIKKYVVRKNFPPE